jgi:glutathione synthase
MRLAIVVNDLATEEGGYTTTRLALTATNRGHDVWYMGVGDLALDEADNVRARARQVPKSKYKSSATYLHHLRSGKASKSRINLNEFDLLFLRNNPAEDSSAWAQQAGIMFGRVAMRHGVIVLNDPNGLAQAMNKMYFQLFPEEVRPKTLITRDRDEIKDFANDCGRVVLKPLQGSGGQSVFLARPEDVANLNQMIDAVSRDGYVIAQEYLPGAEQGDLRLFMMNGLPLRHRGKYAAFRRVRQGGDLRSNLHAGGRIAPAEVDGTVLRVAEIVRPKLVQDGMFLVGLDIVGEKLMEINVFSPGGLGSAQKMEGVNFNLPVIQALERKVQYNTFYGRNFDNLELAAL